MHEEEVRVDSGGITLAGSLTGPDNGMVVLCIHGTGPMDRDENAGPQKLNVFNRFAEAFADAGIACLRYDKRGIGQSGGDYDTATHTDLVADARACLDWLRASGRFSRIIALGHSEGTVIAPQIADGADALVLICPFVTPMRDILRNQAVELEKAQAVIPGFKGIFTRGLTRLAGGVVGGQQRFIRRIERTDKPVLRVLFQKVPVASLRDLLRLDNESLFKGLDLPVLLLVAGQDVQCPPEDGAKIAALIGESATLIELPNLSHLLRNQTGAPGFLGYGEQMTRPVEPEVLSTVTDWCRALASD